MREWFDGLSLRKKLFLLVAFVVISLISSIVIAWGIIQRVQIGGTTYRGIEMKTEYIDKLARARLNLNLLNSIIKSQIIEYDPDSLSGLKTTTKKFDEVIADMGADIRPSGGKGTMHCGSCHGLEQASDVVASHEALISSWAAMKEIISQKILPAAAAGEKEKALEVFDGEFFEKYYGLMGSTKAAVDQMREGTVMMREKTMKEVKGFGLFFMIGGLITIIVVLLFSYFFVQMLVRVINDIVAELELSADRITEEARVTSSTSQSVAEMATEMSGALESTSASLEEITAMVQQNDHNSAEANAGMKLNGEMSAKSTANVSSMQGSMRNIKKDSDSIATIISEIEAIAFQTNLLALNAAVEAARAGEQGQGFAVVADEVRNLAQRAAQAARNSSELLDRSLRNVNDGLKRVDEVADESGIMADSARKVGILVDEIATASHEQTKGIVQINRAVTEMDTGTQNLAATAEELAATAETVSSQVMMLRDNIATLTQLVEGRQDD